jgi:BASS family bile acid:Na+ symporter
MESNVFATVGLPIALFIIMFGLGLSLTLNDFRRILVSPKAIFIGSLTQLVLLPILGFSIAALLLQDSPELAIGLIILSMCPGGPTSNLLTHLGNGDTALCISLTVISSTIKVFTIPIMVNIAIQQYIPDSAQAQLNVIDSIIKILVIMIVPAFLGMFVKARAEKFAERAQKPVKILSAIFLVLVIVVAVHKERANIAEYIMIAGPAALLLNLAGMTIGYYLPKIFHLPVKQQVTISIETSIQNGTLAIAIASSPLMLNNTTMAIPAAVYSLIMFITAGIFVYYVSKRKAIAE